MVAAKLRGWRFGVFEADLKVHELRKRGIHIKLAGQPFQVLALLLQRPGEVVSREELRASLWPGESWGDHDQRLNKAVNKIREALNDSADTPRLIETVPRIGYRFLGTVVPLMDPDPESDYATAPEPATVSVDEPAIPPIPEPPPAQSITLPLASSYPPRRALTISQGTVIGAAVLLIAFVGAIWNSAASFGKSPSADVRRLVSLTQAAPLTTYVGSEQFPAFSPDGKQIAFAWDGPEQKGLHIYVMASSGSNLRQLTKGPFSEYAPTWSPDGSRLALVRESTEHTKQLWIIGAAGGQERKVAEFGRTSRDDHPIAWTNDPHWLVAAASREGDGPSALYLISPETGEQRRLTSPPMHSAGDLSPSISPDGKRLAFTRGINVARRDIFVVPLTADLSADDEPTRLTNFQRMIDTVTWTPDSRTLYFSASLTPSGARHLFRLDPSSTAPVELGIEGIHPAISPASGMLSYVRSNIEQTSIWRLDVPTGSAAAGEPKRSRVLSSTRRDYTADFSPDGKQIVFSSIRSGASEIWMANTDGSNIKQITYTGASTPRWSPDGRRIAHESSAAGQPDIYVFDLETREDRRLTSDSKADLHPSWSRDGRFVYFSSLRSGRSQIWKGPVGGGAAKQITRDGGIYAIETFDGKSIYYTSASQPPSIRSAPADGGAERTVVENFVGRAAISLGRNGLYYLSSIGFTGAQIDFFDFATQRSRALTSIDHPVHHFLSSSPDGSSVLFTQVDHRDTDLMLLPLE